MEKGSKIYVAGHTGLLGTALLNRLNALGYKNVVVRTHSELDLTVQDAVESFFKAERPEYVFMAAGLTGGIVANKTYPATFFHVNISMQDNIFECAQKYSSRHVVFYASSCIYPRDCPQPMKEEYLLTGSIEQTSEAYAIAKMAGVLASRSYNAQFKTDRFIALLPNSIYGPNDNFDLESSHVLSAMIRKFHDAKVEGKDKVTLWGSGTPRREFIYRDDIADASIFAASTADKLENRHYNIGSGTDYSIKELADIIAGIVGYKGEIEWDRTKPDGTPRKLLDSTRFLSLGWRPNTPLKEGLESTYRWYVESGAR